MTQSADITRIRSPLQRLPFRVDQGKLIAIVIGLLLALLVLPAIWMLVETSLREVQPDGSPGAWTLDNFLQIGRNGDLAKVGLNSVLFASGATLVSLCFGGTLAWLVERTNAPFKGLAYLTAIISMGTPFVLYVMAWLFLLGRAGPFVDLYQILTDQPGVVPFSPQTLWGMILIEGFAWSPLSFLLLTGTFRAANAEMEEAARMSGASVFDTIWRISMPLATPAILALGLFIFIRNLEAFEVPALAGLPAGISVLTTDIYLSLQDLPPQMGQASAFSTILLVCISILFLLYGRIARNAEKYQSITGKGYRPRPFDLGWGRWIGGAIIVANFLILQLLPFVALLWTSLTPFRQPIRAQAFHSLTLQNYAEVFSRPYYLDLVKNTLIVCVGAATIAMLITIVTGWLAARRRWGSMVLNQLTTVPLIFPGIVMGVALMQIFLRVPIPIYGTIWIIMLGYIIRYMPYGMRSTYSAVLQVHRELEDAAGVSGATPLATLRRIVVPLISPSVVSAWLFIFLISAREMAMALLLAGYNSQVVAVAMYDRWVNGQSGQVSALGLVWTACMVCFATLFYVLLRRHSSNAFGK